MAMIVFSALAATLAEGVYDLSFANLTVDLTRGASTIGLVYAIGYGVELVASLLGGAMLDRRSPVRVAVGCYALKLAVFAAIGLLAARVGAHVAFIVVAAALVDLFNHVGGLALFVLLPRWFGEDELVRLQGLIVSIRSAANLAAPLVAAVALVALPGAKVLFVAAGFQVLAVAFVVVVVARHRSGGAPRPVATACEAEISSGQLYTDEGNAKQPTVTRRELLAPSSHPTAGDGSWRWTRRRRSASRHWCCCSSRISGSRRIGRHSRRRR